MVMLRRTSKSRKRRIEEYRNVLERYDSLSKERTYVANDSNVHRVVEDYFSLLRTHYRWLRIPVIGELANAILEKTPDNSLHHAETFLRAMKADSN